MQDLVWDATYRLGIQEIDEQHKELFQRINTFTQAIRKGEGTEALTELLSDVNEYIHTHLAFEENWMLEHAYPDLMRHKILHEGFRMKVARVEADYHSGRTVDAVAIADFLINWLSDHVLSEDQKLRPYVVGDNLLRSQFERFCGILGTISEGVILINQQGLVEYANQAAGRLLGKSALLLLGNPLDIEVKLGAPYEITRPTADGKLGVLQVHAQENRHQAEKNQNKISVTLRDITEQQKHMSDIVSAKARSDRASQAKSDFLGVMSHEIRTPLNGILGMASLLLRTNLDREQRDYVETLHRSSEHLASIVNDVLDLTKIEAGRLTLEEQQVDLRQLVNDVIELFSEQASRKGILLSAVLHDDVPRHIFSDPARLKQISTNLVNNALKFTSAGAVHLVIERDAESSDLLRWSVMDSGVGIRSEDLGKLFRPFSQLEFGAKSQFGGTGLGLAIAKRLVELMGGRIGATSILGAGSQFWFTTPKREASADEILPKIAPCNLPKTAIIVSKNKPFAEVIHKHLFLMKIPVQGTFPSTEIESFLSRLPSKGDHWVAIVDGLSDVSENHANQIRLWINTISARGGHTVAIVSDQSPDLSRDNSIEDLRLVRNPVHPSDMRSVFAGGMLRPLHQSDATAEKNSNLTRSPSKDKGDSQELVLIVEDNMVNQKVVSKMLQKLGYRFEIVENGRQAIETLETKSYSAVLMDCRMPEIDGFEATRRIRASEGPNRLVPIIAITASAMKSDEERCLASGMDSFLSKPLNMDRLGQVLKEVLETKKTPEI